MDMDRLDALERTISTRFESFEQLLKLILSRLDASDNSAKSQAPLLAQAERPDHPKVRIRYLW